MNYEDRIRERAHRIWEEEGRPEGRHHDHWERACREIEQMGAGSAQPGGPVERTNVQRSTTPKTPIGNQTGARQTASTGSTGLVGAEDRGVGVPDAMGVDDLNVTGPLSGPRDNQPTTGRSKLVGS